MNSETIFDTDQYYQREERDGAQNNVMSLNLLIL